MSFKDLGIHPHLLKAVLEAGYENPTDIQQQAIPKILEGGDLRASAQTGTGKTAAFLLPTLHKLTEPAQSPGKGPRALILVPTRELAMQVEAQAKKYSKYLFGLKSVCIVGGVPYHVHKKQLSRHYDVLIATPGRLIDYLDRSKINLSRVETIVLDEADRMLDMGFIEPVEQILSATPETRQSLLFTATLSKGIQKLSDRYLNEPQQIVIHAEHDKHENITQKLHYVDNLQHKNRILHHVLQDETIENAIIFTATKRHADQLADELDEQGLVAEALHGDMSQRERSRTLSRLRKGHVRILVATDVAARGIDIQTITHVVNFDLPTNIEDYVHRIGRTGRAGAVGTAISLAANREAGLVKKIESYTGQPIDVAVIPGLEPKGKPHRGGGSGNGNGRGRARKPRGGSSSFAPGSKRRFAPAGKRRSEFRAKRHQRTR